MTFRAEIEVDWEPRSDVPEGVIRETIVAACDHLMSQLLVMGVNDPSIGSTIPTHERCDNCGAPENPSYPHHVESPADPATGAFGTCWMDDRGKATHDSEAS